MLRIVAPVGISSVPATDVGTVSAVNVGPVATVNIRIAVEVIEIVDGDVIAAPAAPISPTAAPPKGAHSHTHTERDGKSCRIVARRRIGNGRVRIRWRPVDDRGIVRGHIDDLRVGLLDHNHTLILDDLGFHFLLLGRFETAFVLSFFSHALHGIHHIALLRKKRVAQICRPLNVVGEPLCYIWQTSQCLNARVPGLLGNRIGKCFIFQAWIFGQPLFELHDFERIC